MLTYEDFMIKGDIIDNELYNGLLAFMSVEEARSIFRWKNNMYTLLTEWKAKRDLLLQGDTK